MILLAIKFQELDGKKFLFGVILRSLSRVFNTVALFLPLKILILISSPSMPSYFIIVSDWLSRDEFLLIILAMTPVTYMLYLLTGIISNRALVVSYTECEGREVDLGKYNISGGKLKWFHDHCAKGSSELLIIFISLSIIMIANLVYFISLSLLCGIFFFLMTSYLYPKEKGYKKTIYNIPVGSFIEYCSAVLYFGLFFLIIGFVFLGILGLYESLLVLLVSRLTVQSIQKLLIEGFYIDKDLKSCIKS